MEVLMEPFWFHENFHGHENGILMGVVKYKYSYDPTREAETKTCFVLLERLDEKVLDRHLQKEEAGLKASASSKSVGREHKKGARGRTRCLRSYSKTQRGHKGIGEGSRNVQESELRGDLLRRKGRIRVKALHYTDDEDESRGVNPKENISEKTGGDRLSLPLNEVQNLEKNSGSEIRASCNGTPAGNSEKNPESDGKKKPSGKGTNDELILENILEDSLYKTAKAEKQLKPDARPPGVLQRDTRDLAAEMDCVVVDNINDCDMDKVKSEVEVVEEYGRCGSFEGKVNWMKEGKHWKEANDALIEERDFEAEEQDARDEGEDDRATVVFEKSFNGSATDFEEVFEMAEVKINNKKKKFRKKKMMNRKKRSLVKFKRKRSMVRRTLAKVKKLKKKYPELCGSGQQPAEKTVESVNERHVREICRLVKRLHELYRIISQLQKDLPMNAEHADHFIRTINAQQENFYKEIRKSQKTIMGGYDKMLNSFGSANTVSIEIGKRTSLSKEDIANVISRCALRGGRDEKKRAAGTEEQGPNSSQALSMAKFSKKLKELINDKIDTLLSAETVQEVDHPQPVQVEESTKNGHGNTTFIQPGTKPAQSSGTGDGISDPVSTPCPQSLHSSEYRHPPKSLQRPNNEPKIAKEVGAGESRPTTHFPRLPSDPFFRASQPLRSNLPGQWCGHSKPISQFSLQKNCTHRMQGMFRDFRFGQFPQRDPRDVRGSHVGPLPLRPVHNHSCRAQYRGNDFSLHGGGTISYPPSNNTIRFFQVPGGFVPPAPPVAGRSPRLHIPSLMEISPYSLGYSQGRFPAYHFPQVPDLYSLPLDVRPVPLLPNFDRSKHGNPTSHINRSQKNLSHSSKSSNDLRRHNNVFPSPKSSECNVPNAPSQPFPKEDQCPLGTILTNPAGFLQPKGPTQIHIKTEPPRNLEQMPSLSTGESVKCESCALDPTVPQKLTMRNCRLEAGPILRPKSEDLKSENGESSSQWQESSSDVGRPEALNEKELKSRSYVCAQNGCKNAGVRICKGCMSIIYCSETCQLKHWTLKHKTECHQLKELRG